jgi:hypothetical protein
MDPGHVNYNYRLSLFAVVWVQFQLKPLQDFIFSKFVTHETDRKSSHYSLIHHQLPIVGKRTTKMHPVHFSL